MNPNDPWQPDQDPPRQGMHPGLKALLIVLLGIPAALLVLGALLFGICMLG